MNEISGSAETLMKQASMTAADYFNKAIDEIDGKFGKDYSKNHPELVGAFMRTAALDLASTFVTSAIQDLARAQERIADSRDI